jgi:endonuclease/exonuclease/phosphatase family metal-dependent hydrolase
MPLNVLKENFSMTSSTPRHQHGRMPDESGEMILQAYALRGLEPCSFTGRGELTIHEGDRNPSRLAVRRLLLLALGGMLAAALGCGSSDEGGSKAAEGTTIPFTVMTYNVLFAVPNPGFDPWTVRKTYVADFIRQYAPDLLGLQEPLPWQVTDLLALCPEYREVHWDIDTDATLFYREDRFEVLESGSTWLSPTPDVPWSTGFGNFFPRLMIWNRMHDLQSGLEFFEVDTHFDNTSPSQEMSAPLFLEETAPLADEAPVIVTGDFNSNASSEAYGMLTTGVEAVRAGAFRLTDTFVLAPGYEVIAGEGEETDYDRTGRIDHVFVAGGPFSCERWTVDKTGYGDQGKVPSDHYPVITQIRLAR